MGKLGCFTTLQHLLIQLSLELVWDSGTPTTRCKNLRTVGVVMRLMDMLMNRVVSLQVALVVSLSAVS